MGGTGTGAEGTGTDAEGTGTDAEGDTGKTGEGVGTGTDEKLREDLENQIALGCLLRLTVGLHGATKAFLH